MTMSNTAGEFRRGEDVSYVLTFGVSDNETSVALRNQWRWGAGHLIVDRIGRPALAAGRKQCEFVDRRLRGYRRHLRRSEKFAAGAYCCSLRLSRIPTERR